MIPISKNLKLAICLGGLLAPWLVASANVPAAAQALNLDTVVTLPLLPGTTTQSVLRSFDISFVDGNSHYALASSALSATGTGPASQPGIVTIDTKTHIANLLAVGKFAGACSIPPKRDDFSGPNGLVIIGNEIWVGDGPIYNPSCAYPGNPSNTPGALVTPSTVKVLDFAGTIKQTISTGGQARADELCFNPFTNTVLVANDDTLDSFITFISTQTYAVVGSIKFDGTDKKGNSIVANGIEQCAFNPRDKKFYLNIPATGTDAKPGPGVVLTISEHAPYHVERVFTIDASTGCTGPQGLAVGPSNQMALGCGGTNSLVINSTNGKTAATMKGEGGTDEAWYGPASNQYYFARSTAAVLGVANAGPPATVVSPDTPTAAGSHSVAADPNQKRVFVPIRSSTFSPLAKICSSKGGTDSYGCVAVYDSP
jgi:hypothetical protein